MQNSKKISENCCFRGTLIFLEESFNSRKASKEDRKLPEVFQKPGAISI